MNTESTAFTEFESPIGTIVIAAVKGRVCSVRLATDDRRGAPQRGWKRADDELAEARAQMAAYFAGELQSFSLPLELRGTPFQKHVWRLLRSIPYGTTTTYGNIARTMGHAGAYRAVGRANGDNRIAILIPCHRVVQKDGKLCGYGGGLWRKRYLLDLESAGPQAASPQPPRPVNTASK